MFRIIVSLLLCSCAVDASDVESAACVPSPAVSASLDLSPPFTASALDGVTLRARTAGSAGNHVSVSFVDDGGPLDVRGRLEESVDCRTAIVHYVPAWADGTVYHGETQVIHIQDLLSTSQLIEFTTDGTWYPYADLQEGEDAFPRTYLAGGADATVCP